MPSERSVAFLSLDEALAIHQRLIEAFGGPAGVRDLGLLESALYRPQTGYYDDVVQMGAALFESLLMNHPFVDGNKRTAYVVFRTYLLLNGLDLEASREEKYGTFLSLAGGKLAEEELAAWIREHQSR